MWLLPTPGGPRIRQPTLRSTKRSERSSARRLGSSSGWKADVELVERLVVRQAGHLQPGLVAAAVEHPDLDLEHEVEELAVAELCGLGAVDQLVGVLGDPVQAQLAGVAADPLGDQLSHRSPPDRPTAGGGGPRTSGSASEHLGERHRVLDRVGEHCAGRPRSWRASRRPSSSRVDLELLGAEHELDPLAGRGVRDVVAAALEAEEPVARDDAGGALDDQIGGRRQRAAARRGRARRGRRRSRRGCRARAGGRRPRSTTPTRRLACS